MPVINVHSTATSGQRAPSSTGSGNDDGVVAGRFDQLLARECADEGDSEAVARDHATAAVMSSDRAPIASSVSGVQLSSDATRFGTASVPGLVTDVPTPRAPAEVRATEDSIVTLSGDGHTIVATSVEPAPPVAAQTADTAAANATVAPRGAPVATTISLGGGPVLGAAVADGLTLVVDEDPAASSSDGATIVSRRNTASEGSEALAADLDGTANEEAVAADSTGAATAALIPLVAVSHAGKAISPTQAETIVATGKLASASLVTKATDRLSHLIEAADARDKETGQAKGAELDGRTPPVDLAANMPASAGTPHAGSSPSLNAIPLALNPATVGATPLSSAVLRSGAAETDAAALHHVERLYAPHDGATPSGSAGAFARLGMIGQDTGVALARGVADGRDHVAIRLDPPDLGRIDVQLSFGQDGGLRAVVASDNRAALDLLRRDLDQLQRALADAGVRADAQSFHFSERQSGGSQRWDAPVARDQRYAALSDSAAERPSAAPTPRRLRSSGLIDVFA